MKYEFRVYYTDNRYNINLSRCINYISGLF